VNTHASKRVENQAQPHIPYPRYTAVPCAFFPLCAVWLTAYNTSLNSNNNSNNNNTPSLRGRYICQCVPNILSPTLDQPCTGLAMGPQALTWSL
jgi:hypothetical protein